MTQQLSLQLHSKTLAAADTVFEAGSVAEEAQPMEMGWNIRILEPKHGWFNVWIFADHGKIMHSSKRVTPQVKCRRTDEFKQNRNNSTVLPFGLMFSSWSSTISSVLSLSPGLKCGPFLHVSPAVRGVLPVWGVFDLHVGRKKGVL